MSDTHKRQKLNTPHVPAEVWFSIAEWLQPCDFKLGLYQVCKEIYEFDQNLSNVYGNTYDPVCLHTIKTRSIFDTRHIGPLSFDVYAIDIDATVKLFEFCGLTRKVTELICTQNPTNLYMDRINLGSFPNLVRAELIDVNFCINPACEKLEAIRQEYDRFRSGNCSVSGFDLKEYCNIGNGRQRKLWIKKTEPPGLHVTMKDVKLAQRVSKEISDK